jgi:hypothetical protein
LDAALLFVQLTGVGVSSWSTKPSFIENAVVSSAMDGITEDWGLEGLELRV